MRYVTLGLLLGLALAFPSTALLAAAPLGAAGRWAAAQPLVWAFAAGLAASPRLTRRLTGGPR